METRLNGKELTFIDYLNNSHTVAIDKIADTCPACENGIVPVFVTAYGFKSRDDYRGQYVIQVVHRCPRTDCQNLFLSIYQGVEQAGNRGTSDYVFRRGEALFLQDIQKEVFSEEIEKLSPRFGVIYNQTLMAEKANLNEIVGAGYRKALEVLIKDYLVFTKPNLEKEIKDKTLGFVIHNFIDNDKIKSMSGLAKDVGNDETHYDKRLGDLTMEDLKKLIKLTSHWIVTELLTDKYSKVYEELMSRK